ncbi:conserved hypothetical protein [Desulfofarcimen acetoxidans DSM 771]|jgi:hypothetical protein|uniref:Nal1 N-terminal domain-containing protein n=1 Tax=Desulfofarcimen acetoxidans (strain ATCC 49208 / DSM 771 / KCTC 5769 / VKM B-1644 / 5575) TaxID=485916 RepID=C8W2S1_DESAS|nr:hypothetical protein [Desulfofarcimen acetoxidans]ACV61077.1 conserved hypothetical protein [Desulfofarcimen acetoxidans DSM 771]
MDRFLNVMKVHRKKILRRKNVVGVGVGTKLTRGEDTGKTAIVVFVKKKLPQAEIYGTEVLPKKINDLEVDVVEIGTVRLLGRTDRGRPAQPGVSIAHYKSTAGTLGAIVRDLETGEKFILSNNHVLANATNGRDGRSQLGDPILQPGGWVSLLKEKPRIDLWLY